MFVQNIYNYGFSWYYNAKLFLMVFMHSKQITTDHLHNLNCYRFLRELRLPVVNSELVPEVVQIDSIIQKTNSYEKTTAYGALYFQLMTSLEKMIATGALESPEWDDFILSLYKNDNQNLAKTYVFMEDCVLEKLPSGASVQSLIKQKIRDENPSINPFTPAQLGSKQNSCIGMVYPYYKPTHMTNLATVRRYRYNAKTASQELRLGTQGQYHGYFSRVDPLFKRYLRAQKKSQVSSSPITHIYFNNLPNDRYPFTYQRFFETNLTYSLQYLEQDNPNIAVITLPADKGLMAHCDIALTNLCVDRLVTEQLFLDTALESVSTKQIIRDFHISPKIRELIFGTKENEKAMLKQLLDLSFLKMGCSQHNELSTAQRQAVWVHFIKFELPQYIINVLQPDTYNFACKDAIDRGGISSAYYNLLKSFDTHQPMSRDEFEQALHAAPLMVKGRGMNEHIDIIWNALDHYITAQKIAEQESSKQWLIAWRDANCPPERAGELLERRLDECISKLQNHEHASVTHHAFEVFQAIKQCDRTYARNHALFLDVVVSTYEFCRDPNALLDDKKLSHYDHLLEKMRLCEKQPVSWMEVFLRLLRTLFCMQQPQKKHTENYSSLIEKMGVWRSIPLSIKNPRNAALTIVARQEPLLGMIAN